MTLTLSNAPSVPDLQKSKVEAHRDWFLKEPTLRVDEARRPGKAENSGTVFGMEGSFKKLELD